MISMAIAAYLIVAAFFFGKWETEDYYKGRNGTPRGILLNLIAAALWPGIVIAAAV